MLRSSFTLSFFLALLTLETWIALTNLISILISIVSIRREGGEARFTSSQREGGREVKLSTSSDTRLSPIHLLILLASMFALASTVYDFSNNFGNNNIVSASFQCFQVGKLFAGICIQLSFRNVVTTVVYDDDKAKLWWSGTASIMFILPPACLTEQNLTSNIEIQPLILLLKFLLNDIIKKLIHYPSTLMNSTTLAGIGGLLLFQKSHISRHLPSLNQISGSFNFHIVSFHLGHCQRFSFTTLLIYSFSLESY